MKPEPIRLEPHEGISYEELCKRTPKDKEAQKLQENKPLFGLELERQHIASFKPEYNKTAGVR